MIYTVTFNPAIDYYMYSCDIKSGQTNRSRSEEILFGGKGINVSVVLSRLGADTTALGFIGGFTGEELKKAVKSEGVKTDFIKLKNGMTRINVKIKSDSETEINAAGPEISAAELNEFFGLLDRIKSGDTLVLSGSVPPSLPENIYSDIMQYLSGKNIRFVVDAAGRLLTESLKFEPYLIKPNRAELEEIVNTPLKTDEDIIAAAKELQDKGAKNVLVSLGGDGALLLDEQGKVHRATAIKGEVINTVGSGDSMVAGFLFGADKGYDHALRLGCAAGGATAFSMTLATKEQIMKLLQQIC